MSGKTETVCVERRRHERRTFDRPCKLLHAPSLRYLPARTRDLSPGGALVEVAHDRPLAVGDRVDILVDWDSRGLVSRTAMLAGIVVRLVGGEGEPQRVGIAFQRELGITLAA